MAPALGEGRRKCGGSLSASQVATLPIRVESAAHHVTRAIIGFTDGVQDAIAGGMLTLSSMRDICHRHAQRGHTSQRVMDERGFSVPDGCGATPAC